MEIIFVPKLSAFDFFDDPKLFPNIKKSVFFEILEDILPPYLLIIFFNSFK